MISFLLLSETKTGWMAFSISWALSSATIQSSPSIAIVDSDRDDDDEEDEDEESDILSWRSAIWNTQHFRLTKTQEESP